MKYTKVIVVYYDANLERDVNLIKENHSESYLISYDGVKEYHELDTGADVTTYTPDNPMVIASDTKISNLEVKNGTLMIRGNRFVSHREVDTVKDAIVVHVWVKDYKLEAPVIMYDDQEFNLIGNREFKDDADAIKWFDGKQK